MAISIASNDMDDVDAGHKVQLRERYNSEGEWPNGNCHQNEPGKFGECE